MFENLKKADPEVAEAVYNETVREHSTLELIASENFAPLSVLEAAASVFTNKYAEGYPKRRYYGGCQYVDVVESLARNRAKELFGAEFANVQPHSGTQANMGVYFTVLNPGDTMMGMNLSHGGHLSHGHPLNFTGRWYNVVFYGVKKETETIDYDALLKLAKEHRPKLIVAGASAYPRVIDFRKFREISDEVGAILMVDMAHIAGLIAAGVHPTPVPYSDFVTSTTHKTLRGPRGGFILSKSKYRKELNRAVFPGAQGGPLVHIIAAKAVAFKLAMTDEFKNYQKQIVVNAKTLAATLQDEGLRLVSGGTDNHLMLVDLSSLEITGKEAEKVLELAGITVNKNTIPFDPQPPLITSGIRLGTPALTTRGMKEGEMEKIGRLISRVLHNISDEKTIEEVRSDVKKLTEEFPLYPGIRKEFE